MLIATLVAVVLVALGTRIPVALIGGSLVLLVMGFVDTTLFPQLYLSHVDSYTLLAVPMYLLAGQLLTLSGYGQSLFTLAHSLLRWLPGALAYSTLGATVFMAGMSGSSAADAAAVGRTAIPAATALGYSRNFIASVTAVGGTLGILIPPSLTMILYGSLTRTSVADLFLAGLLPALIAIVLYSLTIAYLMPRRGGKPQEAAATAKVGPALVKALPALGLPVIVMGGIYSGLVTPTEAAAVAVVYALLIGLTSRNLTITHVRTALRETGVVSSMLFIVIAAASVFGQVMTLEGIPSDLTDFLVERFGGSQLVFLIFVNVLFLVLGMFLESFSIMIMMVPLLFPTAVALGIDPIHFAVIVTVNIEIGLLTPPYGTNLFTVAAISGETIGQLARGVLPFIGVSLVFLVIVTYFPWFSTVLVR